MERPPRFQVEYGQSGNILILEGFVRIFAVFREASPKIDKNLLL